jgi:ABC-type nitrate/sulfonate/bicarbonate transport system substrate-binding protein
MVAAGNAEFGVSYQEGVTFARVQDVPIVSIAAVIQHNTSGFAAPVEKGLKSPKDFEGKKYGGWGSPIEEATIDALMRSESADPSKVEIVNIGDVDFFTAVKRDIDFAWIYYAWTGVEAELRGELLDIVYLRDYAKELDYYTPVLITSEKMIAENPDLVKKFMAATARGYKFAIERPEEAGEILAAAEPDLDRELVIASQKWLSPRYQDDAPRWGLQKAEVWEGYANWLYERGLLDRPLDAAKAFTNDFLPDEN